MSALGNSSSYLLCSLFQYFSFICSPTKDLGAFLLERGIRMVFFMVAMSTDSPSL